MMLACSTSQSSDVVIETETLVAISPADFLGEVSCGEQPGKLSRYVVTLFDVTDQLVQDASTDAIPVPLASSSPTACTEVIGFGNLILGHSYVATVDGYDRSDLRPLAVGSRTMVESKTGDWVVPQWTTKCGAAEGVGLLGPALASEQETTWIRGCSQFVPTARPSLTLVRVAAAELLGDLTCGDAAGEVATISVSRLQAPVSAPLACDGSVLLGGLSGGDLLEFSTTATDSSGALTWTARCEARAVAATTVDASCDTLQPLP
jgi:hypothetical protein